MQRLLEKILGGSFWFTCKQICISLRILLYNFISAWLHANAKRKKDKIANTEFSSDKGACASCHCDAGNKDKNTNRRWN